MRQTCLQCIYELARIDDRVIFIGSDLGAGTLDNFKQAMPQRFFMEGISEANIVGLATGLALNNKIVYINTIASFLTRRAYEQIVLDLCLHNVNVRLIGSGSGFVYAPLGPTHQVIEDIAIMRVLPNMTIIAPADAEEMRSVMPYTLTHQGPIYIRLGKGGDRILTSDQTPFQIGKPVLIRAGKEACIISTGVMLKTAVEASDRLAQTGKKIAILHLPTLKPVDQETLLNFIADIPVILTIEEHSIIGGLGSLIAELLAEADFGINKLFRRLGVPDQFPQGYGSQHDMLKRFDITVERACEILCELFEKLKKNEKICYG